VAPGIALGSCRVQVGFGPATCPGDPIREPLTGEFRMADSQKSLVSIVAILAIVILVGLVFWFVREESSSTIEIDLGGVHPVPVWVANG
jgi:hypothetical protein